MAYSKPGHIKASEAQDEPLQDLYVTSYKRDFTGIHGPPASNARPGTSTFPSGTETGDSGYTADFSWKQVQREECQRTGTSSGQRANNPHPLASFMVWKYPTCISSKEHRILGDELKDVICKAKLHSTYQVDYKESRQGDADQSTSPWYQSFLDDKKHVPPRSLDTTARSDYQGPHQVLPMNSVTTRYGSKLNRRYAAVGAVPTVVGDSPMFDLNLQSSYGDAFHSPKGFNVLKPAAKQALRKYVASAGEEERKILMNMLQEMDAISGKQMKDGERLEVPDMVERISDWEGPSWY